jgi:hypothetical protein
MRCEWQVNNLNMGKIVRKIYKFVKKNEKAGE